MIECPAEREVRGSIPAASESRWFESVDFGASALEEEEDHRLVAKANGAVGGPIPVLLTLSMGLGAVSHPICFGDSRLYPPQGTIWYGLTTLQFTIEKIVWRLLSMTLT